MKKLITLSVVILALNALGQTNIPTFIKGVMEINYGTHRGSVPTIADKDVYNMSINVCNSALFHGTITDSPLIMGGWTGGTVVQKRSLYYDVACDVVNPKNPAQTKNVGRLFGTVPIDQTGEYRYDSGNLEISVLPMGSAGGFDRKFTGTAAGKPLIRPANWMDTMQRSVVNITRSVGGKTMTVVLKKYDKMEFRQALLGAGPVQIYQDVTVNGEMLYDYDKNTWFFNNITVQYATGEVVKIDRLTGNIRWLPDADRKQTGLGQYEFDIRVNEPPPNENAAFTASKDDESSFFVNDTSVPSLTGTMKYKDTMRGDTTFASNVAIDLVGNNITKQQTMVLCKMIIFAAVVPMNAD